MHFDLTDLRLFLHVTEAGSITAGAVRSGLALALASARVRGMEEQACQATSGNHPLATSETHPPGCPLLPECLGG